MAYIYHDRASGRAKDDWLLAVGVTAADPPPPPGMGRRAVTDAGDDRIEVAMIL